jgi:hypothetical protein
VQRMREYNIYRMRESKVYQMSLRCTGWGDKLYRMSESEVYRMRKYEMRRRQKVGK